MTKVNWWKWGLFAAIAVWLFLYGRKCGRDSCKVSVDTAAVKRDTFYIPGGIVFDTHYVPKPYKVEVVRYEAVKNQVDSLIIIENCEGIVHYRDTVKIDHGSIAIIDTIEGNRIAGRRVVANLQIPVIKETMTVYQPKRTIGYVGLNVSGGPQNYLYSAGVDFSLKTKNERIYSAGVSLTRDNQVLYQAGYKLPIRFRIIDRR